MRQHGEGGYVSTAVEVFVDPVTGGIRTCSGWSTAFECGAIVNPDLLTNQIQGGCHDGGLQEPCSRLSSLKMARFSIRTWRSTVCPGSPIFRRLMLYSWTGRICLHRGREAPITCVAPAIANAVFNATGVRIRSMPLAPSGLATVLKSDNVV